MFLFVCSESKLDLVVVVLIRCNGLVVAAFNVDVGGLVLTIIILLGYFGTLVVGEVFFSVNTLRDSLGSHFHRVCILLVRLSAAFNDSYSHKDQYNYSSGNDNNE